MHAPSQKSSFHAQQLKISEGAFIDEPRRMQALLADLAPLEAMEPEIFQHAKTLVSHMRTKGGGKGVEAFLHEYRLETEEGIALMCLAEALLRIPDAETASQLIRDTFSHAAWETHVGESHSLFVNASSWGLLLTGKIIGLTSDNPFGILGNAIGRLGEPLVREAMKAAMRLIGNQFVLGEHILDALEAAKTFTDKGYLLSLDILGEGARTDSQAEAYEQAYLHAIDTLQRSENREKFSMSVKLSALHPRFTLIKREPVFADLMPRLKRILLGAKKADIAVSIDAEEAARLDITLDIVLTLLADDDFKDWDGLGFVVQAYQKRAMHIIDALTEIGQSSGRRIPVRLVKGAYWDSEIKWAQMAGLPSYPVFTRKEHTDVSYLSCAVKLLQHIDCFYPQFATHNARTAASIIVLAQRQGIHRDAFEFQRLHGMGELLHEQLVRHYRCRIYAPIGAHRDLLAYLIRRLMENSANTSFVHLMMDPNIPIETLLANPIMQARESAGAAHPAIPLPRDIYQRWQNSSGLDAGYLFAHQLLMKQLGEFTGITWRAAPLVAANLPKNLNTRRINAPADFSDVVGEVTDTPTSLVNEAAMTAKKAQTLWNGKDVETRACVLDNIAENIEKNRIELMALLMREAGKTYADALSEVREAADFCRYYAYQARRLFAPDIRPSYTGESNILLHHGRGVFVCISPWNFPLAIFTGQITAALVTGNSVLAKPAEQTPLIAHKTVQLMHDAGVPKDVLQLLPGSGSALGAPLVTHPAVSGVVFTGSDATAKIIQKNIAARSGAIIPFIAETGGINCMVVDSSALLEQACDNIISSAFGSAGQRCSALRLLYVQEDVVDDLLALVHGAMQKLAIGNPCHLSTDIGPVIDADAKQRLESHIADMQKTARLVASAPLNDDARTQGHFIAPHVFELSSDQELMQEFFGPILHIVRFKQSELMSLPERINAKGYGLTFGIESRIHAHIEHFCTKVKAGNIYVNRSMIGAVVGVQPFGGEELSGTGPKAGGPHYLLRFVTERHVSNNIAAIGGNVALLSQ